MRLHLAISVLAIACGASPPHALRARIVPPAPASAAPASAVHVGFGQAAPPYIIDDAGRVTLGLYPTQRTTLGFHGPALDVATLMNWSYPGGPSQLCALLANHTVECVRPWFGKEVRRWGPFPAAIGVSPNNDGFEDVCIVEQTRLLCLKGHIDSATNVASYEPTIVSFDCREGRCLRSLHKGYRAPRPDPNAIAWDFDPRTASTCVVLVDGHVRCTGDDFYGQLGDGKMGLGKRTAEVSGIADAIDVAVGSLHACARHRDGRVSCWGALPSETSPSGASLERHPICPIDRAATTLARAKRAEENRRYVEGCLSSECHGLDCHLGCVAHLPEFPIVWIHGTPCEEPAEYTGREDMLVRSLPVQATTKFTTIPVVVATDVKDIAAFAGSMCMVTSSGDVDCFGAPTGHFTFH